VWEEVNSGVGRRGKEKVNGSVGGEDWEDVEGDSGDGDNEMGGVGGAEVPEVGAIESTPPAEPVMVEGEKLEAVSHTVSLNGVEVEDEIT
jgi:hypothetical protein